MKKKTIKEGRQTQKLSLHSETLRVLSSTELQEVAGALTYNLADCGTVECQSV